MNEIKNAAAPRNLARNNQLSGIPYPYYNLEQSIKVARAIHEKGGGACTPEQLASFLDYSGTRNGTYVMRVSSAKLFGLIQSGAGTISISDRARTIISPVMPDDDARERVDAFLSVPLFKAIYEKFKGAQLPPEQGLKNLFAGEFKIVKDRINPSIRVFYESAEQAGFFLLSGNKSKLIPPITSITHKTLEKVAQDTSNHKEQQEKSRTVDNPTGIHPAIIGLLRELPSSGSTWPATQKTKFLDAFKATIDFIYTEE